MKDEELDRISCLPGDIIDQILSHLPIKEAARTSVLSSKWSNNWYTLPNLVFDKNCVSTEPYEDSTVIHNKFSRIVDHVLLLHYGPINKFEINDNYSNLIDIDRWILHLIRRSIKKLVLKINGLNWFQPYKIPWRLFSCQSLQHLELSCCCLKPPMTFKGFKNLKNLRLSNVKMTQDDFENLISSSPLLEKLIFLVSNTFKQIDGFKQINIYGPNLKVFDFIGDFEDISFHNTFKLSELIVHLSTGRIQGECSSNLLQFFIHLPNIQSLEINHSFLKV
jgi:hypothetical protein